MGSMSKGTMRAIFHTKPTRVSIMHTHTSFVISQMISPFSVTSGSVQVRAAVTEKNG